MINEFFDITRFNLQYAKWNPETMYLDLSLIHIFAVFTTCRKRVFKRRGIVDFP